MPVVPFNRSLANGAPAPQVDQNFMAMATAEFYKAGFFDAPVTDNRPVGSPMDITSPAQKGELQKTAKDWPEGTDPSVKKIFNDRLKAGDITREQYNKAMRDPTQFTGND